MIYNFYCCRRHHFATSTFDTLLRVVRRERIVHCFFQSIWRYVLALDPLSWYWAYKVIDSLFLTCNSNMFTKISPTHYISYLLKRKTPFYCHTNCKSSWVWWWRINISIMQGTYTRHIVLITHESYPVSHWGSQTPEAGAATSRPSTFSSLTWQTGRQIWRPKIEELEIENPKHIFFCNV